MKRTTWDPNWQDKYADMIATPAKAVSRIRRGSAGLHRHRLRAAAGAGPRSGGARARTVRHGDRASAHTTARRRTRSSDLSECFRVNSFFIAENVREIIQEGLGDYTPIFLSDIPRLFTSGQLPLDVALIQVSPPDERGMCSLGISVDIVKSAAENASLVIAQVNPQMPRTLGDSLLSVHDLDVLVPTDTPLIEFQPPETDEVTRKIGEYRRGAGGRRVDRGTGHRPDPPGGAGVPEAEEGPGDSHGDVHRCDH